MVSDQRDAGGISFRLAGLFRFVVSDIGYFSLSFDALAELLELPSSTVRQELAGLPRDIYYESHLTSSKVHLTIRTEAKEGREPPPWAVRRFAELIRHCLQASHGPSSLSDRVVSLYEILGHSLALDDFSDAELARLCDLLDYYGYHSFSFEIWRSQGERRPSFRCPRWPVVRGVRGTSEIEIGGNYRSVCKAESSDPEFVKRTVQEEAATVPRRVSVFRSLPLVLRAVWFLGTDFLFRDREACFRDTLSLPEDEWFLEKIARSLICYWFNPSVVYTMSLDMVERGLSVGNRAAVLLGLTWCLFCRAHLYRRTGARLFFRVAKKYTKKRFPLLLAGILNNSAVISYYRGDMDTALRDHAKADRLFRHHSHPWYQIINMSNALRTTVALDLSVFSSALLRRAKSLPEFQRGPLANRTLLIEAIHYYRQDGTFQAFEKQLAEIESEVQSCPPVVGTTMAILLTIYYYYRGENGKVVTYYELAKKWMEAGNARGLYGPLLSALAFRLHIRTSPLQRAAFRGLPIHSRWTRNLNPELRRHEEKVATARAVRIAAHYMHISAFSWSLDLPGLFSSEALVARGADELVEKARQFFQRWFPDFRYQLRVLGQTLISRPEIPPGFLQIEPREFPPDGMYVKKKSANGRLWSVLYKSLPTRSVESQSEIWLAFPDYSPEMSEELLVPAQQTLLWLAQAVARVDSEEFRKQLEQRERRNETVARLGVLAQQLAHDIRSPIAALKILEGQMGTLPDETRSLIQAAISRIQEIAAGVLQKKYISGQAMDSPSEGFSREPAPEILSLLVDAVLLEKKAVLGSKPKILIERVEGIGEAHLCASRVEADEFKRMLSNLIDNAVDTLGDRGRIRLTLGEEAGYWTISVDDTGHGIPPEILPTLGSRGVTYGKKEGLGLGLYSAKKVIERWNGKLEIRSVPEKGTSVLLRFPKGEIPAWYLTRLVLPASGDVVVLDDDPAIHRAWETKLAAHLPKNRIHCFSATIDLQARRAALSRPSLLLLDYELREEKRDGLTFIEETGWLGETILVSSRFDDREVRAHCARMGIKILPKPLLHQLIVCAEDTARV